MASQLLLPLYQFFDGNGDPLVGGKLYTYLAGTTTPAAVYTDSTGNTPHTNPVVLDANGFVEVWISDATTYKFILKDANDVQQWSVDNIAAAGGVNNSSQSSWVTHAVTDGQAATALTSETIDFATYSSAIYDIEIIRGLATFSFGQVSFQNPNGTPRVRTGGYIGDNPGVTFSLSLISGQNYQINAALSSGPGDGTIKMSRRLIAI